MKWDKRGDKKKIKRSLLVALCLLTAGALTVSAGVVTLAKYITQNQGEGAAVARPFYFSSDKLGEDSPYYQIDEPGEGQVVEISFTLSNFVDTLRRTDTDIHYEYRVINGDGQPIASAGGQGTLAGTGFTTTPAIELSLAQEDFGINGVITVEAESTSPYEKLLSAQFGFAAEQRELQVVVGEQGDAVVLELAGGNGGSLTVSWPDTLSPDLSNTVFEGASPGTVTFIMESGARYGLTFLKHDPSITYTVADFTISQP